MADEKPWFLVMTPADANRPDSQWMRHGASSRGKIVVLPIAPEGWAALAMFVMSIVIGIAAVWIAYFFLNLPIWMPIAGSLLLVAGEVFVFVQTVRRHMTRLPPKA